MSPRSRKQLAALISMLYTFLNIILATIELDGILMVAVIKWHRHSFIAIDGSSPIKKCFSRTIQEDQNEVNQSKVLIQVPFV